MKSTGGIFILSAPSGTGKSTVCSLLKQKMPDLKFSISHTTREPRDGESNGSDYHFISQTEFKNKIQSGEFLEWAKVFNNYYGTTSDPLEENLIKGDNVLIELDVQGAQYLRKNNYKAVFIFIMPPSLKELEARLKKRGTETANKIQDRLEVSKKEIQQSILYDYILTNIDVEETSDNLKSVITGEQFRKERYQPSSSDIKSLIDNRGSS
jgi:guanylate kinase